MTACPRAALPLCLALLTGPAVAADAPPPADASEPTPGQMALYDALKVRHDPPACAAVSALSPDPVADLAWLVDHAEQPAWVGVRAVECLLQAHAEAAGPRLQAWVADAGKRGVALIAANELPRVAEAQALPLARALMAGPHAALAGPRLALDPRPAVQAVAAPVGH